MTNIIILKKAILKAFNREPTDEELLYPNIIIFNHIFAKAFWGEERHHYNVGYAEYAECEDFLPAWEYHLQQLVLLSDNEKFKYLEKFL